MAKSQSTQEIAPSTQQERLRSLTPKEYAEKVYPFRKLYKPIGAIVMAFSRLESTLTMTIDALSGLTPAEGRVYEALMISFTVRVKLFNTLAMMHTKQKELREDIKGLVFRLKQSNEKRNSLIHGELTGISSKGEFGKVKYRAGKELKQIDSLHKVAIDDMWEAHNYILATAFEIAKWRSKFNRAHCTYFPPGVYRTERYQLPEK
jgi:hypothetical protein